MSISVRSAPPARPAPGPSWAAPVLAAVLVLVAAVTSGLLAVQGWRLPQQSLSFPGVEAVPSPVLGLFVVVALGWGLVAALTAPRLVPSARTCPGRVWFLLVLVLAAVLVGWACLYLTTLEDPIIPIFEPLNVFLPAVLAGRLHGTYLERLTAMLLVLPPVVAVEALGWCLFDGAFSGVLAVAVFGGFGLVMALVVGLVPAPLQPRPLLS